MRLILTSHTNIVVPPECGFIVWLHEKYQSWTSARSADKASVNQFLSDLYSCRKFDTWGMSRGFLQSILLEEQPKDYASLCAVVVFAYSQKLGKTPLIWGDKNNCYTDSVSLLNTLYPQAQFLHIVRDGRDVACSYREVMQAKSTSRYAPKLVETIDAIASEWSSSVLNVEKDLADIAAPRRLLIRYEDLVQEPNSIIERICEWIGVGFEVQMLNFHEVNRSMTLEPKLTLDWKKRTLEPISAITVGRYLQILSAEDNAQFVRLAGVALSRFGYVSENCR